MGAQLVAQLAQQIAVIDAAIAQLDEQICERFDQHPDAQNHKQALIALARRRITTLWAMLRDRTTYQEPPRPALAPAA